MNSYICAYLFAAINWVIGQKYKVIPVSGNTYLDQFGITPESNQLISEINGCSSAYIAFRDLGNTWRYIVRFHNLVTGKMNVSLEIRTMTLTSGLYNHGKDCDTFIKIKIGWKDGNFAVWSYYVTGWNKILTWNNTLPVMGYIKVLQTGNGHGFQWKVYALEHSTSPYRVTCINL